MDSPKSTCPTEVLETTSNKQDDTVDSIEYNNKSTSVTKRSRSLKSRLHNVKSIYIPRNTSRKTSTEHETVELLNLGDNNLNSEIRTHQIGTGSIQYQLTEQGLISSLLADQYSANLTEVGAALDGLTLYMYIKEECQIDVFSFGVVSATLDDKENSGRLTLLETWHPTIDPTKKAIHVITLKTNTDSVYVSGYILSVDGKKEYLIAKFDKRLCYLARTKLHNYPKFTDIDTDRDDSLLIVSSPIEVGSNVSQICKMTPGFEHRTFYANLSSDTHSYDLKFIASHSAGNRTWVFLNKSVLDSGEDIEDCLATSSQEIRSRNSTINQQRLLSLKCCSASTSIIEEQLPSDANRKERIDVKLWNVDNVSVSEMTSLRQVVVAIDAYDHRLVFITWDEVKQQPSIHKICRDQRPTTKILCSDGNDTVLLFIEDKLYKLTILNEK